MTYLTKGLNPYQRDQEQMTGVVCLESWLNIHPLVKALSLQSKGMGTTKECKSIFSQRV